MMYFKPWYSPLYVILMALVLCPRAAGQIETFDDLERFSEDAFRLTGAELIGSGGGSVVPQDQYRALGVTISGDSSLTRYLGGGFAGRFRNEPLEGTSAGKAMVFHFASPLKRLHFLLGNGAAETTATLRVLTAQGDLLGSIEKGGFETEASVPLGIETSHPAGIATIILDYDDDSAEQIADLVFDYLEQPEFRLYLPQVVHGRFGDLRLSTTLQIEPVIGFSHDREIEVSFFDPEGNPVSFPFGRRLRQTISWQRRWRLLEGNLQLYTISGVDETTAGEVNVPVVGYAVVKSNTPVTASAIYHVHDPDGNIVSEARVPAGRADLVHAFGIEVERGVGLDAALAIANPGEELAVIFISGLYSLLPPAGNFGTASVPTVTYATPQILLGAGEQVLLFPVDFVAQFHGYDPPDDFRTQDQALLSSTVPIAVTIVRTFHGLPLSGSTVGNSRD